jgi:hypothetical protein
MRAGLFAVAGTLVLSACPPRPQTFCDAGGPVEAAGTFNAFLSANHGANQACAPDSGCALVQNPCGLTDNCELTQVAVAADQEGAAEELSSRLTAEQCPSACAQEQEEEFDGELGPGQINSGNVCDQAQGTAFAACVAGTCTLQIQAALDAGEGSFENLCNFGCNSAQFCDISVLEMPCTGQVGVFTLGGSDAGGVCAPLEPMAAGLCVSDLQCGEDSLCNVDPNGSGAPCQLDAGSCACSDETCPNQFNGFPCPAGCGDPVDGEPVDDLRNCEVCICSVCPPP